MIDIQENVSLLPHNTFGVAAKTRFFAEVASEQDLIQALEWQQAQDDCPLLVLGGGSNMLFTRDWPGLVLQLSLTGHEVVAENDDTVQVRFMAGENWHEAVMYTVAQGWGGLENLSLIPGQVGTAPIQNIGAYGVEVKDTIISVEAISIAGRSQKLFKNRHCQFGYRDSIFKRQEKGKWIITAVTFELQKQPALKLEYGAIKETLQTDSPSVKDVAQAVISIRQSKLPDPAKIGNGGSFFKNPIVSETVLKALQKKHSEVPYYPAGDDYKIPAAWLIDTAGWKGYRQGYAGVHDRQALVLVNHGQASGAEIWALAQTIQADVQDKFGITLDPEINII